MRRKFYLHQRNGIYYAELVDLKTQKKKNARSTGTSDRDEALIVVAGWLRDGIPPGRKETDGLIPFLERFWDYDESVYVKDRLAHGQRIGRRHCYDMGNRIRHDWEPFFKGKRLSDLTRKDLKAFSLSLSTSGKYSAATINMILRAGKTALRWAHENEILHENPFTGIPGYSGVPRARGILTPVEVSALFRSTWRDERARVGNLIAACTGLRLGEVLALRTQDIGIDRIFVRHSWSFSDRLKSPKTGKERCVPLLDCVRREVLVLSTKNPYGSDGDEFLFFSQSPDRPMDGKLLLNALHDQLDSLSIPWKERNITFHSWRHWFSRMIADRVDQRTAMLATGHLTGTVFEAYADHRFESDFGRLMTGTQDAFGQILNFR